MVREITGKTDWPDSILTLTGDYSFVVYSLPGLIDGVYRLGLLSRNHKGTCTVIAWYYNSDLWPKLTDLKQELGQKLE